jgi:hypothetical protein
LNLAEIREKHRLKLFEEKILDRCEERTDLTKALSKRLEIKHKEHHELRMYELGLEIAMLWSDYRKLAGPGQQRLDKYFRF